MTVAALVIAIIALVIAVITFLGLSVPIFKGKKEEKK